MRAEHFHEAPLKVRVPRGNEGFWQIICQLHETIGAFSVADIDGESNVSAQSIRKYLRLLVAGGFVVTLYPTRGEKFAAQRYRLVKFQKQAPRVRGDGSIIPAATAMEHLWTAIRAAKVFGLKDLIFAATTEDVAPTYALAKRYVHYLTAAGYLVIHQPKIGSKPAVWRLKPGMNSGPLAPCLKAVRADALWDPNTRQFVGAPAVAAEVSP